MKKAVKILLILLFINCYNIYSQEINSVNKWQEYIEELAEENDENSEFIESLYNDLSYIQEHPFNLNTITSEQLQQLPFLTDEQIENLLKYKEKSGFTTIYELKNILDFNTIELILPFVRVIEKNSEMPLTLKNALKYGENELLFRYDRNLNEKAGYKDVADSILQKYPNRKYLGEPFYNSVRYSFDLDSRLQAGFVAEKDAGEAFWNDNHKGYDYYSAHLFLQNIGRINSLAVGDYKMSFGQGLVVSNDFSPSRSSIIAQAERRNNGFRRHYATNENDFFRGAASTIALGNTNISAFYSYRKIDGTTDGDTISSFKTDGLHRTVGDIEKRHTIGMQTFGGNVRYSTNKFSIGATALHYSFDNKTVNQIVQPYNRYYFRGESNTNASIDYAYRHRRFTFFGETAFSENGAAATVNALQLNAASSLKALILYRNYGKRYQSYYGNAFAQSSTVQNEEGVYIGLQWNPVAHWAISGYADFFRYPWLKYGIDAPSSGKEYMLQSDFNGIKNTTISLRYKYKQKESNAISGKENALQQTEQHRVRLQAVINPSKYLNLKTIAEYNLYDTENSSESHGYLISQSVGYRNPQFPLQIDFFAAYFNADDYDVRITTREKNMLYYYSIPSFYGKGIRTTLVLQYKITRKLTLSVKAALTHYSDRDIIGSNLEEIEGNNKADINTQIRWRF